MSSELAVNQLTLRGFDAELERRLREVARKRSISLNRAALFLMRKGAGLAPAERGPGSESIGAGLDKFIGVWSEAEERQLLETVEDLRRVDPELWK